MSFFKKMEYPATVLLTGAVVLVLEISATKILSPYFGNTIFSVSGIITVVLTGLSLGYYFGGKLADKKPLAAWYYGIISFSAAATAGIFLIKAYLLPIIGKSLPLLSGPLAASALLFFFPVVILGMVSPYAVKLQEQRLREGESIVGRVSGQIFFWSTLGSIFGSLATSFILVPALGLDEILLACAAVLLAVGSPFWAHASEKKARLTLGILLVLLFAACWVTLASLRLPRQVLYQKEGLYEKISVLRGAYKGRPAVFLMQDRSSSAAAFPDNPDELVYEYTKYYSLHELFSDRLNRALVIGGGGFSIPKALLREDTTAEVEVAEIEPELEQVAKKYFGLKADPRLKIQITDGRKLLADSRKPYDLIFNDVYFSLYSVPGHFTTQEFFQLTKSKLSPKGVFIANLIGNLADDRPSFIKSEIRTFESVFPYAYVFAVESPSSEKNQNIILAGSLIPIDPGWESTGGTSLMPDLKNSLVDTRLLGLERHKIFTDDFSPSDFYLANILGKTGEE